MCYIKNPWGRYTCLEKEQQYHTQKYVCFFSYYPLHKNFVIFYGNWWRIYLFCNSLSFCRSSKFVQIYKTSAQLKCLLIHCLHHENTQKVAIDSFICFKGSRAINFHQHYTYLFFQTNTNTKGNLVYNLSLNIW